MLLPSATREEKLAKSFLFVLNDAPYGNERSYNALRWAHALLKQPDTTVRLFLLGDAVACAIRDQQTPTGYYNVERMLKLLLNRGAVAI